LWFRKWWPIPREFFLVLRVKERASWRWDGGKWVLDCGHFWRGGGLAAELVFIDRGRVGGRGRWELGCSFVEMNQKRDAELVC
jgi:hypothetical protein